MKLTITGARLVDAGAGLDEVTDLHLADGVIAAIGAVPPGFVADRILAAAGQIAMPGIVDLSVRLREPGQEYKATLESELRAAVAGGVTTLVCPPDTDPPLDEPGLVEMLVRRAAELRMARVLPLGALTLGLGGERLTEMAELTEAGCIGFYQALAPIVDTRVTIAALQYAATFGYTVWLTPMEPWLATSGVAHAGEMATRLGLKSVPVYAEGLALAALLRIAEATGVRLHVARLTTAEGVALVRSAKARGMRVSADVAVHHLHLSDRDIGDFDSNYRVMPPFAAPADREALTAGIADGTIDAICSDHAPFDEDAKLVPFAEAEPGVTAVELLLPLVLRWAEAARIPLPVVLAAVSSRAAAVIGEPCRLAPGAPANVTLFDPHAHWRVSRTTLASQGLNTPFIGHELNGRVTATLVAGVLAFERGASH